MKKDYKIKRIVCGNLKVKLPERVTMSLDTEDLSQVLEETLRVLDGYKYCNNVDKMCEVVKHQQAIATLVHE